MIKKKKYRNASAGGSSGSGLPFITDVNGTYQATITDRDGNYSYNGRDFYDKDGNEVYVLDNYTGESGSVGSDDPDDSISADAAKAKAVAVLNSKYIDDGSPVVQETFIYNNPAPDISQQNDSLKSLKSLIETLTKLKAQTKQSNANSSAIMNALKQAGMPNNSGLSIEQNNRLQDGIDPAQGKIITGNYQLKDISNFIDLLISNYTYVSKELEQQLSLEGILNTKTTQPPTQTIPKQDKPVNTINKKTETKTETNNTNSNTVVDTKDDKKSNTAYYYMVAGLIIIGVSIFLMLKNK